MDCVECALLFAALTLSQYNTDYFQPSFYACDQR